MVQVCDAGWSKTESETCYGWESHFAFQHVHDDVPVETREHFPITLFCLTIVPDRTYGESRILAMAFATMTGR